MSLWSCIVTHEPARVLHVKHKHTVFDYVHNFSLVKVYVVFYSSFDLFVIIDRISNVEIFKRNTQYTIVSITDWKHLNANPFNPYYSARQLLYAFTLAAHTRSLHRCSFCLSFGKLFINFKYVHRIKTFKIYIYI